jgi:hypothetical protein
VTAGPGGGRRGVYPGTFNPPTTAHVEIARTALAHHRLDRVDLAVSRLPFDKEHVERPLLVHRLEVLAAVADATPGLGVVVTDARLIVDIATGYDLVVMGADKWAQIHDLSYYDDEAHRDGALARLPEVAVAPRPPDPVPPDRRLPVPDWVGEVSSSAVRENAVLRWMAPAAAAFDARTGAWSDPPRYEAWLRDA